MWRYVAELLYNSIAAKRKFVKDEFSYKLGVKINLIVVKEIFLYLHEFCYVMFGKIQSIYIFWAIVF